MKLYQDFTEFKNDFEYKAAASRLTTRLKPELVDTALKRKIVNRIYVALERALAREVGDPTIIYIQLYGAAVAISRTFKKIYEEGPRKRNRQIDPYEEDTRKRNRQINSTGNNNNNRNSNSSFNNSNSRTNSQLSSLGSGSGNG